MVGSKQISAVARHEQDGGWNSSLTSPTGTAGPVLPTLTMASLPTPRRAGRAARLRPGREQVLEDGELLGAESQALAAADGDPPGGVEAQLARTR